MWLMKELIEIAHFTKRRANLDEPNISSPPCCEPSPISVFDTLRALREVASDITMISPAPIRKTIGVLDGPLSEPIIKLWASPVPLVVKARKEASPVKGTPMKLTKSLPANASAKAKVPSKTTILNTFIFN